MKFTESEDGVNRATIMVEIRLTKQEMEHLKEIAKFNNQSLREYLEEIAETGIQESLDTNGGMQ